MTEASHRFCSRLPTLAALIAFLAVFAVPCSSAEPQKEKEAKTKPWQRSTAGDEIFTNLIVLKIQIEVPTAGINVLRRSQGIWGNNGKRPEVKCTVREGGIVYSNVAVHIKGAAGSFRSIDDDPALTLHFDKYVENQSFHGLKKISLNNSVQDSSFLSEKISRELFDQAGVPVPRAGFATLELNHRDLGPRVLIEGYGKQFLKRYFANTAGNLYDGGFVRDVNQTLAVNSGENPDDQSDRLRLVAATKRPVSLATLEKVLDMDRFFKLVAMDVITCNWDGYAMNKNNFRLFHDATRDKMIFMPHGMDQMFGYPPDRVTPQMQIIPPYLNGMVASAVLSTAEGKTRLRNEVGLLYTNVFDVARVTNRIGEFHQTFRPVFAARSPQAGRYYDQQVRYLISRVVQRGESLRQQLNVSPPKPVSMDARVPLKLTGWKPKIDTNGGNPIFSSGTPKDGIQTIEIEARNGLSIGSYRTTLTVGPGKYRFEGDVKLENVTPVATDARGEGGVCLRISRGNLPDKLKGSSDWKHYVYPFTVDDAGEVTLVCEMRAQSGKVLFNTASLKLIKE